MPTQAEAHTALDLATQSVFSGYTVIYKNQDAGKQTTDYVQQLVFFLNNSQYELGNSVGGRQTGKLVFIFCVRKGTGSAVLNTWGQMLVTSFRSKTIGGVVLGNLVSLPSAETENWSVTVTEIPFYFDG